MGTINNQCCYGDTVWVRLRVFVQEFISVEAVKVTFENSFSHRRRGTRKLPPIDADCRRTRRFPTRRRYPWSGWGRGRVRRDGVVHRRSRDVYRLRLRCKVGLDRSVSIDVSSGMWGHSKWTYPVHRSAERQPSQQILAPFVMWIGERRVLQQTSWYNHTGTTCVHRNGYLRLGLFCTSG